MKICLAVADMEIEEWLTGTLYKTLSSVEFTKPALHTGAVLDVIKLERPDIVILREELPTKADMSVDVSVSLLLRKIRSSFTYCRVIVIAGDHKEGDNFLKTIADMGVYDVAYGRDVRLSDVVDMVSNPRGYDYGQKLQGITDEEFSGLDIEVKKSKVVEEIPNEKYREKKPKKQHRIKDEEVRTAVNNEVYNAPTRTVQYDLSYSQTDSPQSYDNVFYGVVFDYIGYDYSYCQNNNTQVVQNQQETQLPQFYSQGYNSNKILSNPNYGTAWQYNRGSIVTFCSGREGVGTTTVAINTAYNIAITGKRVLLIDGNFGTSAIFSRFGFRDTGYTLENIIENCVYGSPVWDMCVSKVNVMEQNSDRFVLFPDTLRFLKLSENTGEDYTFTNFDIALSMLSSYYDYILIDSSLARNSYLTSFAVNLSDRIVIVTTQDLFDITETYKKYERFSKLDGLREKTILCVNKFEEKLSPSLSEVAGYFRVPSYLTIRSDYKGFLKSASDGLIYSMSGKKKVNGDYYNLLYRL